MFKRYIVEFGSGADLHGMDVTKAAKKAVKDAVSHACLCGVFEILGGKVKGTKIQLKIGTPFPEKIDAEEVKAAVPFGEVDLEVAEGGLTVKGLDGPKAGFAQLGEGDTIVIVNAAITVWLDVE